jgi:hypothetical protein
MVAHPDKGIPKKLLLFPHTTKGRERERERERERKKMNKRKRNERKAYFVCIRNGEKMKQFG